VKNFEGVIPKIGKPRGTLVEEMGPRARKGLQGGIKKKKESNNSARANLKKRDGGARQNTFQTKRREKNFQDRRLTRGKKRKKSPKKGDN